MDGGLDAKEVFKMALWLYFKDCYEMAWEGIQFIGKRLEGWRAKMQGEGKA